MSGPKVESSGSNGHLSRRQCRQLGSRWRGDASDGHGLLALLLAHQQQVNLHTEAQMPGCQTVQHALLLALQALLACPTFPPLAVSAIAASGELDLLCSLVPCCAGISTSCIIAALMIFLL